MLVCFGCPRGVVDCLETANVLLGTRGGDSSNRAAAAVDARTRVREVNELQMLLTGRDGGPSLGVPVGGDDDLVVDVDPPDDGVDAHGDEHGAVNVVARGEGEVEALGSWWGNGLGRELLVRFFSSCCLCFPLLVLVRENN